jgi:hypothetical protein
MIGHSFVVGPHGGAACTEQRPMLGAGSRVRIAQR